MKSKLGLESLIIYPNSHQIGGCEADGIFDLGVFDEVSGQVGHFEGVARARVDLHVEFAAFGVGRLDGQVE